MRNNQKYFEKIQNQFGLIEYKLLGISERKVIDLVYEFLEWIGEGRKTRPKSLGKKLEYIGIEMPTDEERMNGAKPREITIEDHLYYIPEPTISEDFQIKEYSRCSIGANLFECRKDIFEIFLGGHPSSEIYLKLQKISIPLETYLENEIRK